jgi:hypothetical protein
MKIKSSGMLRHVKLYIDTDVSDDRNAFTFVSGSPSLLSSLLGLVEYEHFHAQKKTVLRFPSKPTKIISI